MHFLKFACTIAGVSKNISKSGCGSVWLERHLREVEVASSNLVTPIKNRAVHNALPFSFARKRNDDYEMDDCFGYTRFI